MGEGMFERPINRRSALAAGTTGLLGMASPMAVRAAMPPAVPGGFSAKELGQIPRMLQSYVDDGSVAGIVTLLYRKGVIPQVCAVGFRDLEARAPMRRDTIFRLASMTKPITCAAALTLVDQGRIGLFDPIGRWIPELASPRVLIKPEGDLGDTVPAARPITVADLLTHRAGLAGQSDMGPLAAAIGGLREGDPTFDVWLQRLGAIPLAYHPGERFNYGTSHDVLGALISRVTGRSFEDYLRAAIFDPLGMIDTAFWVPAAKQHRLAQVYGREGGKLVPTGQPLPLAPPNFQGGAGALVSTVDDYLKFARMLLGKGRFGGVRILERATVAMMTTNWLTPEQIGHGFVGNPQFWASQGFGLGVSVTTDVARLDPMRNPYSSVGSFGWPGSTGVYWRADPVEDLIAIYMIQSSAGQTAASPGVPPRVPPVIAFANAAYDAIE
jgi:CubicO group peptidase (beta-lactamase class C family)